MKLSLHCHAGYGFNFVRWRPSTKKKKKKKDISRDTMQSTILTDILKKKIHHKEKKTVLGYVSGFFCIFVQ